MRARSPTLLAPLLILLSSTGHAADKAVGGFVPLMDASYTLRVIGSLLLVILLLVAVMALLRRFSGGGVGRVGLLRVRASISLGGREKAVLVQVGEELLLLGVSPGGVRLLHRLDGEPNVETASRGDFRDEMRKLLGGGGE
ncbi:flagellar biosynthetic protein FliO [Haliea atlantica]